MSNWITNRRPDASDANIHGDVWFARESDGIAVLGEWRNVARSDLAWCPCVAPSSYDYSKDEWIKIGKGSSCKIPREHIRSLTKKVGNTWYARKLPGKERSH